MVLSSQPTSGTEKDSKQGVAAVDRALCILSVFDTHQPRLSLAEISRKTNLYKSTILRLITTLELHGYIIRDEDGLFSLGSTPLRLAKVYQSAFNLKDILYPVLQKISIETGETSSFYISENNRRVILFRVEPARSVKVSISEGDTFPLDVGAAGKILSAFSNPELSPSLMIVKNQNWAYSFGERDVETSALSVPVFSSNQKIEGALTVSGPIERLTKIEINQYIPLLLEQSIFVSKKLGANTYGLEQALNYYLNNTTSKVEDSD